MSPLAALLGAAALLLVGTATTARRPQARVPDLGGYFTRWSATHGGHDPDSNRWVRGWLALSYRVALPLARVGVQPDVLTAWAAWSAFAVLVAAAAGGRWPLLAAAALVISGALDSLDGCVAALTDRASRWGYVLDSVVDRLADGLHLLAVWLVGGPAWLALAAAGSAFLQEYARARAGNAGMGEIGVVTVGERATRVILCAGTLALAGALPDHAALVATGGLAALAAVGVVALGQLLVTVRGRL